MQSSPSPLVKPTSPFRYGVGMFGTSIPVNMFKSFAAIFYVDTLGLSMDHYSLVLFIYTFLDAIDNPIYGFLSDNTRTKWGRRRPWLVIGTPLLVLFFLLFYNVPNFVQSNETRLFWYMLVTYLLTGTLDSVMNAGYGALFPELFKKDADRAKANAVRQTFQLLAMVISIALTPMITEAIGYSLTSVIYGVVALAVVLYCAFGCHENPENYTTAERPHLIRSIVDLLRNPKFWIFGACGAFYSAAFSLISQAVPFYVKYTLGLGGNMTTVMLGIVFAAAVLGILCWSRAAKKVSVMKIWRAGFIIMAVAFLPLYFVSSFALAVPIACVVGFGVAACLTTMDCIGAKIVDDDYEKHGIKREGTISSLMGVMNRLNGLYTSLAFFVVGRLFSFESGDAPGPNPGQASRVLLCLFPAAAMILATVFSFFLHFRKAQKEKTAEKEAQPLQKDA